MGSAPAAANVIQGLLEELHERYQPLNDGSPATCIPELATADGRVYEVGDS
ncbi:MAG: hypothetical protein ACKO22_08135 [Cyanobium sp.]